MIGEANLVTVVDVRLEVLSVLLAESLDCLRPNPRVRFHDRFQSFSAAHTHRCLELFPRAFPFRPRHMKLILDLARAPPLPPSVASSPRCYFCWGRQ